MKTKIEILYEQQPTAYTQEDFALFAEFLDHLNKGIIRSAEKTVSGWQVNTWVKKGILLGFRMGALTKIPVNEQIFFTDKHTYGIRCFPPEQKIRMVPGGSAVREGAYLAAGVTLMPPMYINTGAYVDENTMIDSHALVGSCAQVGKNVHLSAGAILGGVLEPIGAKPVIIEDDCFIGANSAVLEGVLVKRGAILAAGVVLTQSTPVFDAVANRFLEKETTLAIPEEAVVVPGSRPLKTAPEIHIYCPVIIKYRDGNAQVSLEQDLR